MNLHEMLRRRLIFTILFFWLVFPAWSQLSEGGTPLDVSVSFSQKSSSRIVLPSIDNEVYLKKSLAVANGNRLKPFHFAEPIPVSYNTENSGRWVEIDQYRVWQLVLVSKGAKSMNLMFDRYKLPDGARLFLFNPYQSDVIGAFTSKNNSPSLRFVTSPVIGDQLVVQYEEPLSAPFDGELSICQVNHDFVGIKSLKSERRPLGIAESCNINVNCELAKSYHRESGAICRILINSSNGGDLCTGALVNNTNEDGTPYVYTAGHCIDDNDQANNSVFLFNYESPYCGEIDGDASHSLSGSVLKAASDSLDFSLVELYTTPPPSYRPYFLGWERGGGLPDSSACIHHPLGDIKKIAIDRNSPKIKTYSLDYIKNGFFLIGNWEEGTTEGGSSGAPLINQNRHMVGSLTGGAATCSDPRDDYFARLNFAWDRYSAANKQLKTWLDPKGTNAQSLDGFTPYTGSDWCSALTNLKDDDIKTNMRIEEGGVFKGYWSGNNSYGFSDFAEKFDKSVSSEVIGVSYGVAKASLGRKNSNGKIEVSVYQGDTYPGKFLYSQTFDLGKMLSGVMNYLTFNQPVQTKGTFFISYSLDLLEPADTFSVYLAKRTVDPTNSFYIKDGQEWYPYPEKANHQEGTALLMEVLLCNMNTVPEDSGLKAANLDLEVFPNPLRGAQKLLLKFKKPVEPYIVQVFDLLGRRVNVSYTQLNEKWLSFDFSGKRPGNYFFKIVDHRRKRYRARVVYLGD